MMGKIITGTSRPGPAAAAFSRFAATGARSGACGLLSVIVTMLPTERTNGIHETRGRKTMPPMRFGTVSAIRRATSYQSKP
jgi:hypothetical protein